VHDCRAAGILYPAGDPHPAFLAAMNHNLRHRE
jgi:hypothetical protein